MYFGSVRFFKHIILSVVALLIVVPTTGFVYFAFQYNSLKIHTAKQAELMRAALAKYEDEYDYDTRKRSSAFTVYASEQLQAALNEVLPYHTKYPDLYVENNFEYILETEKTIYLTFDDGPANLTPHVLDILKDRNVRATFFVVYKSGYEARALYQRIIDEGHALGLHSATHNYRNIYNSVDSFLEDMAVLSDMLENVTGVKPEILRFPGGSINSYNAGIYQELIAEVTRRGYTYYDWDASAVDTAGSATADSIRSNVLNGISGKQRAIVLMHDVGNSATVTALPGIIDSLEASGYQFEVLDKTIRPIRFDYPN